MAAPKRLKIDSGRKRLRLSMTSKGVAEAKGKVQGMQRKLANLMPVLKVGARDIETLMFQSFEKEIDPGGKKWGALKPSTVESRVARGDEAKQRTKKGELTTKAKKKRAARRAPGGLKILDVSGKLKESMHATATSRSIKFGSNKEYLSYHMTGTKDMVSRKPAPVEKRGANWALIRRGPALAVFNEIEQKLRKHVAGATLSLGAR